MLLVAVCDIASARPIRINFEDLFDTLGEDWTDTFADGVDLTGDGTFGAALPFDLNIGLATYDAYCVSENGQIWFGAGGADACGADPGSDPLLDVLSVLNADWESTYDVFESSTNPGAVSVSLGFVDRDLDGDGTFELADGVDALRFLWNDVTLAGDVSGQLYAFQAILFGLGGGDFDLEFNYGLAGDAPYAVGIQSITGAGIVPSYNGTPPFGPDSDFFFGFRAGEFTVGTPPQPPTTVPEPGTLWLLVAGASCLLWSGLHRYRSRKSILLLKT